MKRFKNAVRIIMGVSILIVGIYSVSTEKYDKHFVISTVCFSMCYFIKGLEADKAN